MSINDGLIGHWSATVSGDATDLSTGGNNGTYQNGAQVIDDATAYDGTRAFDFPGEGVTSHILLPTGLTFQMPYSVAFWIKSNFAGTSVTRQSLFGNPTSTGWSCNFRMDAALYQKQWQYRHSSNRTASFDTETLVIDQWCHVVATLESEGGPLVYYLNGVQLTPIETIVATITGNPMTMIGSDYDNRNVRDFRGQLDGIRFYDRVLSAGEAATLFNAGRNEDFGPIFQPLGGEVGAWIPTVSGDATDLVGSNDGTEQGGVSYVRDRERGGVTAWNMTATGAQVTLPSGTVLDDIADEVTVSFWVNRPAAYTGTSSFYEKTIGGAFNSCLQVMQPGNNFLFWRVYKASGHKDAFVSIPTWLTNDNQWYHVACTYRSSDGNQRIYIDGVQADNQTDAAEPILTGAGQAAWGAAYSNPTGYSGQASFDDCRIFNRALAPSEIKELYKRGYQRRMGLGDRCMGAWIPSLDRFGRDDGAVSHDLSGAGNLGTLSNGAVYQGKAYKFNGTSQVTFDTTARQGITNKMTAACWVRIPSATSFGYFFSDSRNNDFGWVLGETSTQQFKGSIRDDTSAKNVTNPSTYNFNQWYHLAVVGTGTQVIFYVDGIDVGQNVFSGNVDFSTSKLQINGRGDNNFGRTNAEIDDCRIYNRALSATEIADLALERGHQWETATPAELLDPVGAWVPTLDLPGRIDGTVSNDLSGGGNAGTLQTGVTYSGKAFDTDGSAGAWVNLGDPLQGVPPTAFSQAVWVKRAIAGDFYFAQWAPAGRNWSLHWITGGQVYFQGATGTSAAGVLSSDDQWHHFAGVFDGVNGQLYVDGVAIGAPFPMTVNAAASDAGIFGSPSRNTPGVAQADDARIWFRALSAAEIATLASRRGAKPLSYNKLFGQGVNNEDVGLAGHYRLQETAGTVAVDSSAMKRDGTYNLDAALPTTAGPKSYLPSAPDLAETEWIQIADNDDFSPAAVDAQGVVGWGNTAQNGTTFFGKGGWEQSTRAGITNIVGDFNQLNGNTHITVNEASQGSALGAWLGYATVCEHLQRYQVRQDEFESVVGTNPTGVMGNGTMDVTLGRRATNASFNGPLKSADFAWFTRWLETAESGEHRSGPEPICTVLPSFFAAPEVGTEASVNTGTWIIDPSFTGDNGVYAFQLDWYIADDADGLNETWVATTTAPAGYTPLPADENKYLRSRVRGSNAGGFDVAEDPFTDYAQVTAGSAPIDVTINALAGGSNTLGHAPTIDVTTPSTDVQIDAIAGQSKTLGTAPTLIISTPVQIDAKNGETHTLGYAPEIEIGGAKTVAPPAGQSATEGVPASILIGRQVITLAGESRTLGTAPTLIIGDDWIAAPKTGASYSLGHAPTLNITQLAAPNIQPIKLGNYGFLVFKVGG